MLETSRPPQSSAAAVDASQSPKPVENGRHRRGSITLETQNLSKPSPPRTTASSSMANGTGHVSPNGAHVLSRRPSWLSNISSKFSSTGETHTGSPTTPTTSPDKDSSPKNHNTPPGFLISTLRRLSSTGTTAREAFGRRGLAPAVATCERIVLNKDETRERCVIPELDGNKLRKVSFCVDVEVAPCHEDVEARKEARRKRREAKEKERLKQLTADGTPEVVVPNYDGASPDIGPIEIPQADQKETVNGLSEVTNGTAAVSTEEKGSDSSAPPQEVASGSPPSAIIPNGGIATEKPKPRRRIHPKPTTDPMKIYTQCCQLRETRILPEVKEALLKESCPAVLQSMDLTGYKFQLCDAVTFSDFLALVPIKRLILEDCDLIDETVRMILSALSAVKPISVSEESEEKSAALQNGVDEKHHRGVIEKLSFKGNPKIGRDGWRYISVFIHMSHSLKALDVSKIALPRPLRPHAPLHHGSVGKHSAPKEPPASDITTTFSKALGERLCGHGLEELVMGQCALNSDQLKSILEGVVKGETKRLSLEGNALTDDGLAMVGRWMKGSGVCEALDLSNNNVQDHIDILSASINELSPLCALKLSNCNLTPTSLSSLLPALSTLPNFRMLNLSNNPLLFSIQPDSFQLFRRFLPRMRFLRSIDLANTSMTSDQAIALCEVLPDVRQLAFFKITENPLVQSGHAGMDEGSMEEGAALYTALVAAVKVSKTLMRVDVDEPGSTAGDVIHKLSKRLLAYCLRNMETGTTEDDWAVDSLAISRESSEVKRSPTEDPVTDKDLEDEDRADYEYDENGVWQDEENYVVGGTGVVKALGVCLGNKPQSARANALANFPILQRADTFSSFGSVGDDEAGQEKANEMSKVLLTRARNIKERIQPALRKGYAGDIEEMHHRRLLFLDDTLYRVIHRFEEEYPECRQPLPTISEPPPSEVSIRPISTSVRREDQDDDSPCSPNTITTHISKSTSRPESEVSLHSKFLQNEEGQMHKLGQYMKHEMLADTSPIVDEEADAKKARRVSIMQQVEALDGEELRRRVMEEEGGVEEYISRIEGWGVGDTPHTAAAVAR
ncbi:RNI-like protein [Wilcoxina mikolae CBS 423.85]|nr:RNI-like protein [Wilcoxina mikolae CBS 423.85]